MKSIKLISVLTLACVALNAFAQNGNLPIAKGSFKPTDESLATYQVPDWFRDAKFGIWSCWGPQCVPRVGDWYARKMYWAKTHPTINQVEGATPMKQIVYETPREPGVSYGASSLGPQIILMDTKLLPEKTQEELVKRTEGGREL